MGISLLMQRMVPNVSKDTAPLSNMTDADFYRRHVGLAFQQLAELRHRGAFSTVSQTFSLWCVSCARSDNPDTRGLPQEYYQVGLDSGLSTVKANAS